MRILILNGPNINMLGIREPGVYGSVSYAELCSLISRHCSRLGIEHETYQSNHEGALIDKIQEAYGCFDGIVFNPGAYTHTSIALLDALKAVGIPCVEVHLTDTDSREPFRKTSFIRSACLATISGRGPQGYLDAIDLLLAR